MGRSKDRSHGRQKVEWSRPTNLTHLYAEQNVNQTSIWPITWGPMHDERLHFPLPVGKKHDVRMFLLVSSAPALVV